MLFCILLYVFSHRYLQIAFLQEVFKIGTYLTNATSNDYPANIHVNKIIGTPTISSYINHTAF